MGEGLGWEGRASGAPSMPACLLHPHAAGAADGGGHPVPGWATGPHPHHPPGQTESGSEGGGRACGTPRGRWGAGEGLGIEGAPAFPIRKHILWASGRYLLQLATPSALQKQPPKQPFPPCRETGKTQAQALHTHAHSSAVTFQGPMLCGGGRRQGLRPAATAPTAPSSAPALGHRAASPALSRLPCLWVSAHRSLRPPGRRRTQDSGLSLLASVPPGMGAWPRLGLSCSRYRRPGKGPVGGALAAPLGAAPAARA